MSWSTASAQFTNRSNSTLIPTKLDTLKVPQRNPGVLNMKIYDDAYDKYLRKLQNKQRNWIKVESGLLLTQTSFTNWAAGGNNSFSGRAFLNLEHKYNGTHFNIHSIFNSAYGIQSSDGITHKNEDYFKITSTPSWRIARHWELSGSLVLNSQFNNSYAKPGDSIMVSTFFAPAYLTVALGVKYNNLKKTIEIYDAPISGNLIMVLNKELANIGKFGEKGRQYIPQFINYFRFTYNETLFKSKLTLNTKLETFWDYKTIPRMVAETKVGFKFAKLFGVNLYAQAIYDDKILTPDAKEGIKNYFQFTEVIGFGLTYNFVSKKHPAPPEEPRSRKVRRW